MKTKFLFIFCVGLLITYCGSKTKRIENNPNHITTPVGDDDSFIKDASLGDEVVEANLTDSIETLSDSNDPSSNSRFLLVGQSITDNSTKERSCEESDNMANVRITRVIDRTVSIETKTKLTERQTTGNDSTTREWSMESGEAVKCTSDAKFADIKWNDLTSGLILNISFDRSREDSITQTNKKKNLTVSATRSHSASGLRTVSWISQTKDMVKGTLTIKKTIDSIVARKHKKQNKKGELKEMELTVKTKGDAPLSVEVVRSSTTHKLQQKTIESGTIVASKTGDGRVESEFKNFKISFSGKSCNLVSGKVITSFYNEQDEASVKSYQLEVTNGDYTLTDLATGEEITDFELPGCSAGDFD